MAFDLDGFMKDFNLTESEMGVVRTALNTPERLAALEKNQLRQTDYSKHMNAIQTKQTELAAANDRLNAEMVAFAEVQADGGKITAKMRTDLEKAQTDVLRLTQTVTKIATDNGLDPDEVLKGVAVVPPRVEPVAPNLEGYVKSDDLRQQAMQLANMALTMPAELMALAQEHQDLFGKPLDTRTIVAEIQARAGTRGNQKPLDPRSIWEEQHNIPQTRSDKDQAQRTADIAKAREEGRIAGLSEQQVPGGHSPAGRHSPVFVRPEGHESALKRPQPGSTVGAAVSAFRTGKYRTESTARTA